MSKKFISLDSVSVASPCPASWEAMAGDDRVRSCGQCQRQVYNLSELSRSEAEALVGPGEGDAGGQRGGDRPGRRTHHVDAFGRRGPVGPDERLTAASAAHRPVGLERSDGGERD